MPKSSHRGLWFHMEVCMQGIYLIQNEIDGKMYIGQAEDIGLRWSSHLSLLQSGKHPSKYLQQAVNKYGIENFSFTVICECEKEKLNELEQYYIYCLETTDPRVGYNRQYGGTSNRPCADTRRLMSEAHKGKKHSEETKRKIGASHKGMKYKKRK